MWFNRDVRGGGATGEELGGATGDGVQPRLVCMTEEARGYSGLASGGQWRLGGGDQSTAGGRGEEESVGDVFSWREGMEKKK